MKQKYKKSTQALLASLRGRQVDNNSTASKDLDQIEDQVENENTPTPTLSNDNLNSSSSSNEASSQVKEESLIVKIRDTLTGEVTTQRIQPDRVWNLKKNKKNHGGTQW